MSHLFHVWQIMPDLSEARWKLNDSAKIEDGRYKDVEAAAYSWIIDDDMGYGESTASYTFFISKVL